MNSKYNKIAMHVELQIYDSEKRLLLAESVYENFNPDDATTSCFCVFIPGLTEGLLATEYLRPLSEALNGLNIASHCWKLIQFTMTSSYTGYGTSSLENDAKDITKLLKHLVEKRNAKKILLLGHSTGCQDIIYLLRENYLENILRYVKGYILQAPVSDRDYFNSMVSESIKDKYIELSYQMIQEGIGEELMPLEALIEGDTVPINANRYFSLHSKGGLDDMFSNDLSTEEMQKIYTVSPISRQFNNTVREMKSMIIFSGSDEYVPPVASSSTTKHDKSNSSTGGSRNLCATLLDRITAATNTKREHSVMIEEANHALTLEKYQTIFLEHILSFVRESSTMA